MPTENSGIKKMHAETAQRKRAFFVTQKLKQEKTQEQSRKEPVPVKGTDSRKKETGPPEKNREHNKAGKNIRRKYNTKAILKHSPVKKKASGFCLFNSRGNETNEKKTQSKGTKKIRPNIIQSSYSIGKTILSFVKTDSGKTALASSRSFFKSESVYLGL